MKEKINLLFNNINRLLSNEEVSYRLYLTLAVATFVIVGIFGIIPSTKNLISNITLAKDIRKNNVALAGKLIELKKSGVDLNNVGTNISFLDSYVPEDFNLQNYLVDFVFASGEADLVLERLIPIDEESGSVNLSVSMIGNGDPLKLINVLESLNRISEIQSFSVFKGMEYNTISMIIKTFIMEKQ
jgi:hypothetical protein